jgi:acyl-coenzyme A synthetase/AMP-(fatty) acid ligase
MCPVPERTKLLPYQTAKFIAEERITVWYSVPSALALLLPKLSGHDLGHLRWVLFAGEEMPLPVLRELTEKLPEAKFANLYGPTETNVCTWHDVQPGDFEIDEPLSIGRPISDTRLWIMNEEGTSADGLGELWVAGPTVTAGYAGDRRLTEAKLVPAPDGQGLAYRTGDLVSRRTDGRLRFHGRIDRMIKRRGYRIEPGEIESALMKHVTIRECAVLAVKDASGEQLIKACVVPAEGQELQPAELRTGCREWLPDYMVPDIWDVLPQLPRTDRGKIDWKKL